MFRILAAVLATSTLVGCGSSDRWDEVDWELEETYDGRYTGDLGLRAQAHAAFVPVRTVSCTNSAELYLSPDQVATGTLSCDFGDEIGMLAIDMTGAVFQLPLIAGTVEAEVDGEDLEMGWEGGFTGEDAFFGELAGEEEVEGFRVTFEGWFEVSRAPSGANSL